MDWAEFLEENGSGERPTYRCMAPPMVPDSFVPESFSLTRHNTIEDNSSCHHKPDLGPPEQELVYGEIVEAAPPPIAERRAAGSSEARASHKIMTARPWAWQSQGSDAEGKSESLVYAANNLAAGIISQAEYDHIVAVERTRMQVLNTC